MVGTAAPSVSRFPTPAPPGRASRNWREFPGRRVSVSASAHPHLPLLPTSPFLPFLPPPLLFFSSSSSSFSTTHISFLVSFRYPPKYHPFSQSSSRAGWALHSITPLLSTEFPKLHTLFRSSNPQQISKSTSTNQTKPIQNHTHSLSPPKLHSNACVQIHSFKQISIFFLPIQKIITANHVRQICNRSRASCRCSNRQCHWLGHHSQQVRLPSLPLDCQR